MTYVPAAPDTASCRAAACATGAAIWQFARENQEQCWIGASCDQNLTASTFVGEARGAAPPTPKQCPTDGSSPCAVDYNDSGWRADVTTPHDFVVEVRYPCIA